MTSQDTKNDNQSSTEDFQESAVNSPQNLSLEQAFQLALQRFQAGNLIEAELLCRKMLLVEPDNADVNHFIGVIVAELGGKDDQAIQYIKKAIQTNPDNAEFHKNLGLILERSDKLEEAISSFEKARSLQPDFVEVLFCLGLAYQKSDKMDEAIECYRRVISFKPDYAEAYNNLGNALTEEGEPEEAIASLKQAVSLWPDYAEAHKNLGFAFKKSRRTDEAIASFRQALSLNHDFRSAYSCLIFMLNYSPNFSQEKIYHETLVFVRNNIKPGKRCEHFPLESKTTERKIRVGYISPDFRKHSIFFFIEPLLKAHNKEKFEIYCYSDVKKPDEATRLIEEKVDHWRPIAGKNDIDVFEDIKQDSIDILVELAGHTANNRLAMLALKPAPIQVSWLGYPNTTGLEEIEYRFTDIIADPLDQDKYYSEELIRLKNGFLCYHPYENTPDVFPPPCLESNTITFGSFNNLLKVTLEVIDIWSEILLKVPDSRLLLKNQQFKYDSIGKRFLKIFADRGISRDRIDLVGMIPERFGHLAAYNKIDIALDPFPYNGTTTTCEALWMGVPVITLLGSRHASRVGASLMHSIDLLGPFVADSAESYIEKAVKLARDKEQLIDLRKKLRQLMEHSPLCDTVSFAEKIEDAYLNMWGKYMEGHVKENP